VQDICDRVAILYNGELQVLKSVKELLEIGEKVEVQASGLEMTDSLRGDLEAVFVKHGGKLEFFGHPTTTLEDLFLRIIAESKAHPGRRYMPEIQVPVEAGAPATSTAVKQ
jgi:ABC-2 type transport system ATP-binding protein